jgi:hypothetical protein
MKQVQGRSESHRLSNSCSYQPSIPFRHDSQSGDSVPRSPGEIPSEQQYRSISSAKTWPFVKPTTQEGLLPQDDCLDYVRMPDRTDYWTLRGGRRNPLEEKPFAEAKPIFIRISEALNYHLEFLVSHRRPYLETLVRAVKVEIDSHHDSNWTLEEIGDLLIRVTYHDAQRSYNQIIKAQQRSLNTKDKFKTVDDELWEKRVADCYTKLPLNAISTAETLTSHPVFQKLFFNGHFADNDQDWWNFIGVKVCIKIFHDAKILWGQEEAGRVASGFDEKFSDLASKTHINPGGDSKAAKQASAILHGALNIGSKYEHQLNDGLDTSYSLVSNPLSQQRLHPSDVGSVQLRPEYAPHNSGAGFDEPLHSTQTNKRSAKGHSQKSAKKRRQSCDNQDSNQHLVAEGSSGSKQRPIEKVGCAHYHLDRQKYHACSKLENKWHKSGENHKVRSVKSLYLSSFLPLNMSTSRVDSFSARKLGLHTNDTRS